MAPATRGRHVIGLRWSCAGLLLLGALASLPGSVHAGSDQASISRLSGSGSSLSQLGRAIRALAIDAESLVVVGLPPDDTNRTGSKLSSEAREALRKSIQKNVAALIPLAKRQVTEHLTPEQARLEARRADLALVYVQPTLHAGSIRVEVTYRKWSRSFWRRALAPRGIVTLDRIFEIEADSQIRSLFPRTAPLLRRERTFPAPVASPLAIACGDFGRDLHEIVIVGRSQIAIGRYSDSNFVTRQRRSWSDLSDVSAFPLRAPLASVTARPDGITVGLSDRAHLVGLDAELGLVGRAPRTFPLTDGSCSPFTDTGVSSQIVSCPPLTRQGGADRVPADAPGYDAFSQASLTESSGERVEFSARLPVGEAQLEIEVRSSTRATRTIEISDSGYALALGDVDGDGTMDVVTSRATANDEDAIRIHSLSEGQPALLATRPLAPVHALALCPFSGENPLSLVVLSGENVHTFH